MGNVFGARMRPALCTTFSTTARIGIGPDGSLACVSMPSTLSAFPTMIWCPQLLFWRVGSAVA
eukprot:2597191-Amphidinium_carterae.1